MDVLAKVKTALKQHIQPAVLDIEDDDGIIGVVVSDRFRDMESLGRQMLLQKILRKPSSKLSRKELRKVAIIVLMTPAEYAAYAPRQVEANT